MDSIFPPGDVGLSPLQARDFIFDLTGWRPSDPWITRGMGNGVAGQRLRSIKIGGKRFTCATWIREFLAAYNVPAVA